MLVTCGSVSSLLWLKGAVERSSELAYFKSDKTYRKVTLVRLVVRHVPIVMRNCCAYAILSNVFGNDKTRAVFCTYLIVSVPADHDCHLLDR